jgi:methyl-accepting chemotaxis protein/methyl-accepting chemotaxis protein-1 (serine sensor receptor)
MANWSVGDRLQYGSGLLCILTLASGVGGLSGLAPSSVLARALLAAGFIAGIFVVWTARQMTGTLLETLSELRTGSAKLGVASTEIASNSQVLSEGASQQAASLEEISASIEEMTAMARRNGENSAEAAAMMTETSTQVMESNHVLQEMVASMDAIKLSSEKVAKIIKTIDEIAFQTNILALNAAVEAARAGEAGMGFAVVADEVRSLAQRSAEAAKGTAVLIEEAIASSNQGAQKLDQVAVVIRAITESASKVRNLVEEVSEASKQQTQGIDQVSKSVTQVSTVTQRAAASAEEGAASGQQLGGQSAAFEQMIIRLEALVHSGTADLRRPVMPARASQRRPPGGSPVVRSAKRAAPPLAAATFPRPTSVASPLRRPSTKASSFPLADSEDAAFQVETSGDGFRSF